MKRKKICLIFKMQIRITINNDLKGLSDAIKEIILLILKTGISNPNFMEFSDSCKFTCQVLEEKDWYLIDAKTGVKTSLGELLGRKIDDAIFISSE